MFSSETAASKQSKLFACISLKARSHFPVQWMPTPTALTVSPQYPIHSGQLKNQKGRVKQKILELASLRCLQGSSNSNSCQTDLLIGIVRSSSLLLSIQVSQLPHSLSYALLTSQPYLSHQPWVTQQAAWWSYSKDVATKNYKYLFKIKTSFCVSFFFLCGRLHLCLICGYL